MERKGDIRMLGRVRQRKDLKKKCSAFYLHTLLLNSWEQHYLIEITAEKSQYENSTTCGQWLAAEMMVSKTHTSYDLQASLHPYTHYS